MQKILFNNEVATKIIKKWYKNKHCIDIGEFKLETKENFLRLIHMEELYCRKIVQTLPITQSIKICLRIYEEIVYFNFHKYHNNGNLHLCVLEAIRILLYGSSYERDNNIILPNKLFELLEHVEIILKAKEFVKIIDVKILRHTQNIKFIHSDFCFDERDTAILEHLLRHFNGKGQRLKFSKSTSQLLFSNLHNNVDENIFENSIKLLLNGEASGKDISFFKGTYYEFFPNYSNSEDASYKEFLENLLERIQLFKTFIFYLLYKCKQIYSKEKGHKEEMLILSSAFELPNKMVNKNLVFTPNWKRWDLKQTKDFSLSNKPIIKINEGKYITSLALYADSINYFVENEIYRQIDKVTWNKKICQKVEAHFENEVISYMRRYNYVAGKIKQNGKWIFEDNEKTKDMNIKLPGEVDVFAVNYNEKIAYLIECKCLHDVLTRSGNEFQKFKNISNNLSGSYALTLYKKRTIIEEYISKHLTGFQIYTVLLTDVDFPVYLCDDNIRSWENVIAICDFKALQNAISKKRPPKTFLRHI